MLRRYVYYIMLFIITGDKPDAATPNRPENVPCWESEFRHRFPASAYEWTPIDSDGDVADTPDSL